MMACDFLTYCISSSPNLVSWIVPNSLDCLKIIEIRFLYLDLSSLASV